jgi:hypothetical protein
LVRTADRHRCWHAAARDLVPYPGEEITAWRVVLRSTAIAWADRGHTDRPINDCCVLLDHWRVGPQHFPLSSKLVYERARFSDVVASSAGVSAFLFKLRDSPQQHGDRVLRKTNLPLHGS